MASRWVRTIVVIATTLAAWLVVMPAYAAAPLCDDRGATMFAPAPQLQSPETSIDVGDSPDEGCLDEASGLHALQEGRAPSPVAPSSQGIDATLPSSLAIAPASHVVMGAPRGVLVVVPAGVRDQVDRPPR